MRGVVLLLGVLHGGHVRFRLRVGAGFRFGELSCRLGFLLRGALRDGGGDNGGAALINERRAVFFCLLERLGCLIEKHQVQDASHEHDQRHYNQQQGGRNVDDRHQDQHSADNGY